MAINRRRFLTVSTTVLGLGALGGWYWRTRWSYIVVHHSAGNYGNVAFLQQVHRQRQAGDPIHAIPYHYIIGNGNGLPLGAVASDWRQHNHIWGSHVSGNNPDHNWRGIGICLIGNLERHPPPQKQYQSLVSLTKNLISRYGIALENVNGHGHLDGESTLCPGSHFPRQQFLSDIRGE